MSESVRAILKVRLGPLMRRTICREMFCVAELADRFVMAAGKYQVAVTVAIA